MIKERPILMNAENVGGIQDDRKTQTRRVIKPQPDYSILKDGVNLQAHKCPILGPVHLGHKEWGLYGLPYKATAVPCFAYNCPYGKIGDRLWVRETWTIDEYDQPVIFYKATDHKTCGQPWKPSRFMPRWASRITLEITDIRIERLQDISKEDAIAEGCGCQPLHPDEEYIKAIEDFYHLWDSINAKPKPVKCKRIVTHYVSYPWDNIQEIKEYRGKKWYIRGNPFVWVIVFKMIKQEEE